MKSYRMRAGYSQDKLADLVGVSRATYCDYEVNLQKVKVETFDKLSRILNCNLVDFFVEYYITNNDSIDDEEEGG